MTMSNYADRRKSERRLCKRIAKIQCGAGSLPRDCTITDVSNGGVKVVAEWFPERERALASGIFNSGSSVGAILAPPVVAWIILHSGWRAAFLLVGLTGIAWLLVRRGNRALRSPR